MSNNTTQPEIPNADLARLVQLSQRVQTKYTANLENYKRNTGETHPLAVQRDEQPKPDTEVHFVERKDSGEQKE
ncbi:hypothetical protein MCUN1_001314 [Malassezia cuniculi]|uniref:Uncharacterized protein n=1 Tax=Malassezia cuniculi TaxID=948313 RepID=A0AAF0EPI6_9BASI|nr:hypothetical protein MCUN1_001314 [Malassezia cuniculi]